MNYATKAWRTAELDGRWVVLDEAGRKMCCVRQKRTADALMACSFDGPRFIRRRGVCLAVEHRGLIQDVGPHGRRAAVVAALSTFDAGHSAAWAVYCGGRVLDYWTPSKTAPWSVAFAGAMP